MALAKHVQSRALGTFKTTYAMLLNTQRYRCAVVPPSLPSLQRTITRGSPSRRPLPRVASSDPYPAASAANPNAPGARSPRASHGRHRVGTWRARVARARFVFYISSATASESCPSQAWCCLCAASSHLQRRPCLQSSAVPCRARKSSPATDFAAAIVWRGGVG